LKLQWALLGACLALTGCHVSPPSAPTAAQPSDPESEPGIVCSRAEGVGIARVLLRGEQDRAVCSSLRSIAGKPEDARVVEGDIAAIFALGTYDDVLVAREEDNGERSLVFELTPRATVSSMTFDGVSSEPARKSIAELELTAPHYLDHSWVKKSEQRMLDALIDAGYRRASVQASIPGRGTKETALRFIIDEGPRALLARVSLVGLKVATEKEVRAALRLTVNEPAAEAQIEWNTFAVSSVLYDLGLVDAKVETDTLLAEDGARLDVTFRVTEGPVHRLKRVLTSGEARLDPSAYAPLLAALKLGVPFSRTRVAKLTQDIEALHEKSKRPANVAPRIDIAPGTTDITLTFEISAP